MLTDEELLEHIHQLMPLADLASGDRHKLAETAIQVSQSSGEIIHSSEVTDKIFYLLQGNCELRYVDYAVLPPIQISEGSEQALRPVFSEHEATEVCLHLITDCVFMELDRKLFNRLIEKEALVDEHMLSQQIGYIETNIYNEILKSVESGKLKLPSLPEVAVKIKHAVEQPDVKIKDISKMVEMDPALSARMIQVANSALNRGSVPVKSIRDVIVRLGLKTTRNLIMSFCVANLFETRHVLLKKKMQEFYQHSIEVAATAFALGQHIRSLEADQLLLAGLIHDIGVIPVITYIEKSGFEFASEEEVDRLIRVLRVATGVLVVKSWGLPNEMLNVVSHAEHWHRDNGEEIQLVDVIVIAQIYNMMGHKETQNMPDMNRVPAFKKLSSGKHDPAFAMSILDQARDEIQSIQEMLTN